MLPFLSQQRPGVLAGAPALSHAGGGGALVLAALPSLFSPEGLTSTHAILLKDVPIYHWGGK